ncbi:MAG: hypothetical protein GY775_14415 [Candidatus Scalindua sp.]|nr:hypothetical protein [Candidatus Scalindua sp.]
MTKNKFIKTAFCVLLLSCISFLSIQCARTNKVDFLGDVRTHFGDMPFREIRFSNVEGWQPTTNPILDISKGDGKVESGERKGVQYRWLTVRDEEGHLQGFYIGHDGMSEGLTAMMTKDEAKERLRACRADPDTEAVAACENQLVIDILSECLTVRPDEVCAEQCWYDTSQCSED